MKCRGCVGDFALFIVLLLLVLVLDFLFVFLVARVNPTKPTPEHGKANTTRYSW